MAFEITRQEITKQANDLLRLFRQTRVQKYKDEELRLRRIVTELEAFTTGGGSTPTLAQVTTAGNTTTNTIDIGGAISDYYRLDTAATPTPVQGMMFWDSDRSTVDVQLDNDVSAKIGQDNFWYVKNQSGATIPKGKAVMSVGTLGASGRILIDEMVANGSISSKFLLGITAEDIANGADGFVMNIGKLRQVNTTVWPDGTVLYCDPTTAGNLTSTKPSSPNLALPVATVVHSAVNGVLAIRVSILDENSLGGGGVGTLDQVTTAGNRTQNDIYVGTIGSETELSRMTQVIPGALYPNFTVSNYDTLVNGAVVYQNLSGGADVTPLVNNTTYYVKKMYGLPSPIGGVTYANNQVELYNDAGLTSVIYLTANIVGNHYLYQANRNITNTLFANKNLQIEDGFLLINAKQYKTGDVHWISPKDNWVDGYIDDGDGGVIPNNNNLNRQTTLLVGPYTEYSTAPLTNANGTCIIHSNGQSSFIGIEWNGVKYGIGVVLPSQNANSATIGGYYTGLGIGSTQFSSNTDPSFGVLALNQSGNGRGSVNFTVYNNKRIHTFNNVLDNSSGFIGINVDPVELLHVRQSGVVGDSIIRVDNDSANSQSIGGNFRFYRGGQGVITGSTLLGKIDYYGAITGTNMSNYTFVQSASFEVRAVSGAWSTTTNRSAQFLFFTRHQNTYAERMRLTSEGNLLINTTTNGTFRLDVNGTARIQNALTLGSLASDPAGTNGMIYYNTTTNKFRAYENGAWVNII